MNEEFLVENFEREQYAHLIEEILSRTATLLASDQRSQGMTYAEAQNPHMELTEESDIVRRATLRSVQDLELLIPGVAVEIDLDRTRFRSLIRMNESDGSSMMYGLSEVCTLSGDQTRWMALVMRNDTVQRSRGVVLAANGMYSTTDELQTVPDSFYLQLLSLVPDESKSFLSPILNGRLLPGQDLPNTIALVRAKIETNSAVDDIDSLINKLIDRYFEMKDVNDFRANAGLDNTSMSIQAMQALSRHLGGDNAAIGIYS